MTKKYLKGSIWWGISDSFGDFDQINKLGQTKKRPMIIIEVIDCNFFKVAFGSKSSNGLQLNWKNVKYNFNTHDQAIVHRNNLKEPRGNILYHLNSHKDQKYMVRKIIRKSNLWWNMRQPERVNLENQIKSRAFYNLSKTKQKKMIRKWQFPFKEQINRDNTILRIWRRILLNWKIVKLKDLKSFNKQFHKLNTQYIKSIIEKQV